MKFQVFEVVEPRFPVKFTTSIDVYNTMASYKKSDREMLFIIFLNAKNSMLDYVVHTVGEVDTCAVYIREAIRSALVNNASSIIVCHNHPDGNPNPSVNDMETTRMLTMAFEIVGIGVMDHVIIGKEGHYSFADSGILRRYTHQAKETLKQAKLNF